MPFISEYNKKMIFLFVSVVLFTSGGVAELGEPEHCDSSELQLCVKMIPKTPIGLPRTREELDALCQAYQTGMMCMDAWIKKCLPTDGQKLVQQQIGGARALMKFLCTNDTALRKDFLRELSCWARVSAEWSSCVNEVQLAVREITERSQLFTYFNNKNTELCCARDAFMRCVSEASRSCSAAAGALLRRMSWVLAQDVAACSLHPRAVCAAPPPPPPAVLAAPLLAALTVLFYA